MESFTGFGLLEKVHRKRLTSSPLPRRLRLKGLRQTGTSHTNEPGMQLRSVQGLAEHTNPQSRRMDETPHDCMLCKAAFCCNAKLSFRNACYLSLLGSPKRYYLTISTASPQNCLLCQRGSLSLTAKGQDPHKLAGHVWKRALLDQLLQLRNGFRSLARVHQGLEPFLRETHQGLVGFAKASQAEAAGTLLP